MEKKNAFRRFISNLIHDDNDINEKTVLGFASFLVLVLALLVDIITGLLGREFPIHEFMFDGFLVMTLGSLGIASVDKYLHLMRDKKEVKKSDEENVPEENLGEDNY